MREKDLSTDFSEAYDIAQAGWQGANRQFELDFDFYLRAQHDAKEAELAEKQDRTLYTLDKIRRQVNLLSGYEIQNRHILKIGPTGGLHQMEDMVCRQLTATIMAVMSSHGMEGYNVLSNAFKFGPIVQGHNLIELYKDREGDIRFSRLGYNQFLLDPNLTKPDLSDCQSIITGRWLSKEWVKFLLPERADDIDNIPISPSSGHWDQLGSPSLSNKAELRMYEEWWHKETEFIELVILKRTGQEIPLEQFAAQFTNGDIRLAKSTVKETRDDNGGPVFSRYSKPEQHAYLTIFVDGEQVWHDKNPLGIKDYNFVWMPGDWAPECPRSELKLQSHVRGLRDVQRARNRRVNQVIDLIESQLQGLRILRDKYIKNPEAAYKSGQGVVIHTKSDTPEGMPLDQVFQQRTGAEVPAGMFQVIELLNKDEIECGGMSNEMLGNDDKDIPALLHSYRTGQALTAQQPIFEAYRFSKIQLGLKLVDIIQANYTPQKINRLINEMPIPALYTPNFGTYDCQPTEGLLTDNQQMLFYLELKSLRQQFPEEAARLLPFSVMLQYAPTPFKTELVQIVQRAEQQLQMSQQQQMQDTQRMNQLIEAQTAENLAQAQEARTGAALDRAKTMGEINKLRTEPVMQLLQIAKELEMERMRLGAQQNAAGPAQ